MARAEHLAEHRPPLQQPAAALGGGLQPAQEGGRVVVPGGPGDRQDPRPGVVEQLAAQVADPLDGLDVGGELGLPHPHGQPGGLGPPVAVDQPGELGRPLHQVALGVADGLQVLDPAADLLVPLPGVLLGQHRRGDLARRPCFMALRLAFALPAAVLGQVDICALRRLASICAAVAMVRTPDGRHYPEIRTLLPR